MPARMVFARLGSNSGLARLQKSGLTRLRKSSRANHRSEDCKQNIKKTLRNIVFFLGTLKDIYFEQHLTNFLLTETFLIFIVIEQDMRKPAVNSIPEMMENNLTIFTFHSTLNLFKSSQVFKG